MESSGLMSGMGSSGMLGLEIPLHHPQHSNNPHRQHQQQLYQNHQQHQLMSFTPSEADHHNNQSNQSSQSQLSLKPNVYPNNPNTLKGKQQQVVLSDEEGEVVGAAGEDGGGGDGRKRVSPWQRVKWTDSMIRLLIMVVFYIEDDCGGGWQEGNNESLGGNCKKKAGGILQKKGKWKSVSRAMMDKSFFVSPQQCEDKFNDLNKRYKRVNEILGRGTACRVVENQSLLDTMDQLSPKMKEEARKLLNSKHLFFREMCAYHNSGGGAGGGGGHQSSEVAVEPTSQYQSQQRCFHSSNGAGVSNLRSRAAEMEGLRVAKGSSRGEDDEDGENDDEDDEDDDEDEDDDDGDEVHCAGGGGGRFGTEHSGGHDDEDENEKFLQNKRQRTGMCSSASSPLVRQLSAELISFLQDGTKSPLEQRQWMRNQWLRLEEQQVSYQLQAYELEKQRLKWLKFSNKKEREMERMKLKNERMKLENERMVLLLRRKEFELLDMQRQHQDSNKRPEPSSVTG